MTINPEQLAKSREDFELLAKQEIKLYKNFEIDDHGYYVNDILNAMFLGFLLRQQSLVVDLPSQVLFSINILRENLRDPRGSIHAGIIDNDKTRLAIDYLLAAGINYREKE